MITAKDYYYKYMAPEEKGMNYQQIHQAHYYSNKTCEDSRKIIEHIPKLSNDILIEDYMNELINCANDEIAKKLSNTFVVKTKNYFSNAGAHHAKNCYEGNLIFFQVGLSDVLFQYAILFSQFVELKELPPNSIKSFIPAITYSINIEKITEAQIEWGINRNEIKLSDENIIVAGNETEAKAVAIATMMDKAVIRHEIAHHILGHTGDIPNITTNNISSYISDLKCSSMHSKEISADILSLHIPLSGNINDDEKYEDIGIDISLGTLLMQTALSQLKDNIYYESESHPSWEQRHRITLDVIYDLLKNNKHLEPIIKDVTEFQVSLYNVSERGLGILNYREIKHVNFSKDNLQHIADDFVENWGY